MSDCILFEGAKRDGYGWRTVEGRQWLAHRYAYTLAHGDIPEGLCVLHTCDVRNCINVEHLWLGTRADNNRDRMLKGRNGDLWANRRRKS